MSIITRIVKAGGPHPCMRIYLDGHYVFSLKPEAAACLSTGQQLSDDELESLIQLSARERAMAIAMRAIAGRPHSRQEMEQKLVHKQLDGEVVTHTLDNLATRGLLNDNEFAGFWRENRDAFRPRSRALVEQELRRKGVASDIIKDVTASMDDETSAFQAGEKKARTLLRVDRDTFYRRLGDYLRRRGYNYEVIHVTIDKLWQARI